MVVIYHLILPQKPPFSQLNWPTSISVTEKCINKLGVTLLISLGFLLECWVTYPKLIFSRSAIEMLEAELRESTNKLNSSTVENPFSEQQTAPALALVKKQEIDVVSGHH